jgi:ABC-type transporter Mla MlaB component
MAISSRTPEGRPGRCPDCGADVAIEPSGPARDAPCPECGHLIWFDREEADAVQAVSLEGPRLEPESLDAAFEAAGLLIGGQLAIDFREVQDISSAALARLIRLKREATAVGRKLVLRGVCPSLLEVFRLTRLDSVFDFA